MTIPLTLGYLAVTAMYASAPAPQVSVELDEDIYSYDPTNMGAVPMWCYGSSCVARVGDDVFVAGLETIPNMPPKNSPEWVLNNARWLLFKRTPDGWELQQRDEAGATLCPCPLGAFGDGRLVMSVNPTLEPGRPGYGVPAQPQVYAFDSANPKAPFTALLPSWEGTPRFTEHCYCGMGIDGPNNELVLFNIEDHHAHYWSFLDREGNWSAQGKLVFPWGADYEEPEPIRLCYLSVALRNRVCHVLGISDIVEPNRAWRAAKKEITGRDWDYDFRRLFYTWTPDITTTPFADWLEVASVDKTCGWIQHLGLAVDTRGDAHLLWNQRYLTEILRERFYPNEKQAHSLEYAIVRNGEVVHRRSLVRREEGQPGPVPGMARLHVSDDDQLFVLYHLRGAEADGTPANENRILQILPGGGVSESVRVPLRSPFTNMMTATERNGAPLSRVIDVIGTAAEAPNTIRYARLRLQ